MAIGAAAIKKEHRIFSPGGHRVTRDHMALGAHSRIGNFQQPVVDRAVGLMAVSTIVERRGMLIEKRPAPLGMAGITVLVDAGLFELRRIWRAMGVMATGTGELSFAHRHVGGAHELRFALQMTLAANFGFRSADKKRRDLGKFGQLLAAGLFHQSMAVNARNSPARVGARLPIGLDATLMASETCLVLNLRRFAGVFAKCNHSADTLAAAGGDVIASRAMAVFAASFFRFVPRVK